ncbi:MAG TPA: hypothetical protein VFQ39_02350, partial [Longimicrobium sp.]|nr:hypothetical protein [Longimicrobium sp.]
MRNTKFARLLLAAALAAVPARRALAQGADLVGEAGDNTTVERSLCLSIAMAAGAAYECGDLRLAHGLPAVRVLNKVRAPTLVYNSQHASPSPIVSLNYTVPTGTASPVTQVTARVRFHAASGAQRLYTSVYPAWTAGQTRRVAVLVDASTDSTGVYEYDFEILRQHADGSVVATVPASGRLAVVNRKNSPFGAGWWVAGVEALAPRADGSLLWIGGDGSTRLYQPLTDTSWTAPPVDRADTLKRRWVTDAAGTPVRRWVRVLPGRAEVRFDSAGRHVETVNALGHRTLFVYSGPRLARIGLPGAAGYSYHFEFANTGGTLSRVLSPTGTGYRYTMVATDAAGRVGRITDPSGDSVRFGYADATARVRSRTDRRGFTTLYHFDAGARLTTVQVPHADTLAASHAISQESAPLPGVRGALTLDQVFTAHTGYRATEDVTDNSYFFLDRWGAPVRALDPVYHSVRVTRGDARFPALATRTVDETTGRVVRAAYDARGNLATMVDSGTVPTQGVAAVSTYEWDPVWDRVVRATSPEGSVSRTGLDAYGRTAWAQPGNDSTRRTRFEYFATSDAVAPGLARSVKPPLSAAETYGYDAWGNLSTVTGPSGLRVQYRNDAMGRTVATV